MIDSFFDSLPEFLEQIISYAPGLILVAVPIAFLIAYRKTKIETKQAQQSAESLGLMYVNVANEMGQSNKQDTSLLGLFSGWSPWAMEGEYLGLPVRVELVVKSSQQSYIARSGEVAVSNPTRTSYSRGIVYSVTFSKPLPFEVMIMKNIKMPFNLPRPSSTDQVKANDELIDRDLFITGKNPQEIQDWLGSERKLDALKELYQSLPTAMITQTGIQLRDSQKTADFDRLEKNLTMLCNAGKTLQES